MDKPRSNIRNYRPRQEAANLLFVLEQIAAWRSVEAMNTQLTEWLAPGRAEHGEQTAAHTDHDDQAATAAVQRPPQPT